MNRIVKGLRKTKERLINPLRKIFTSSLLDENVVEEIEELLLSADMGVEATERVIERIRERMRTPGDPVQGYLELVADELRKVIDEVPAYQPPAGNPRVIVLVGVNGVGKTSTIGKLAYRFREEGRKVLVAAGDTFRAAAIEQLELWAERVQVPIVRQKMGSDPAAIAFDSVQAARARGMDTVIIDTAGRLHTKVNLMDELKKIFRVLRARMEGVGLEAWLVLDANSGQNSLRQAEAFVEALPVSGLILTKLDSTAKGGIVFPVQKKLRIPVLYVGVGEKMEDLESFDHQQFISALVGED